MRRKRICLLAGMMVFVLMMILAVHFGNYPVRVRKIGQVIGAHLRGTVYPDSNVDTIVWKIRLPRVLTAAFLFAMLAMALAYGFAFEKEEIPVVRLILSGMIISSVFTALLNFLKVAASDSKLREITFWTMGGFYTSEWKGALRLTAIAVLGLILTCGYGWKLNVLAMGEQECRTLGIHAGRLKLLLIVSATFLTASCVAEAGIISWVGLMIPHGARMLIGPDHRYMIPFSALLGGSFLVLCDTLARTLMMGELPVSIVTSILGAPYLIYLLRQNRKVYFE